MQHQQMTMGIIFILQKIENNATYAKFSKESRTHTWIMVSNISELLEISLHNTKNTSDILIQYWDKHPLLPHINICTDRGVVTICGRYWTGFITAQNIYHDKLVFYINENMRKCFVWGWKAEWRPKVPSDELT